MLKDYSGRAAQTAVELINTYDIGTGADALGEDGALAELLTRHGWEVTKPIGRADLDRLATLRPRLRTAFGAGDPGKAVETLNLILQETAGQPRLTNHDGSWHWHYVAPSATLAARVATASSVALLNVIADDDSHRLRVCEGTGCHRVFVDLSKPGTRRFCDTKSCANRAHTSAYRARRRNESAGQ